MIKLNTVNFQKKIRLSQQKIAFGNNNVQRENETKDGFSKSTTLKPQTVTKSNIIDYLDKNKTNNNFQMLFLLPKKNLSFKGIVNPNRPTVLITGGSGYLGGHCLMDLIRTGYDCVVYDNTIKRKDAIIAMIKKHNKETHTDIQCRLLQGNLLSRKKLDNLFKKYKIDVVMHLAGSTQNEESKQNPKKYYSNNVLSSLNLLNSMYENRVSKLVFASTGSTYDLTEGGIIKETHMQNPTTPYGRTKLIVEQAVKDYEKNGIKGIIIRMFNIAGASAKDGLGENKDYGINLIPTMLKAIANDDIFYLFGDKFETEDGTCIKDFVHVEDAAHAFTLATKDLIARGESNIYNVGSGNGYSLKEIIDTAEQVTGGELNLQVRPKRPGDPDRMIADTFKITNELGWKPQHNLRDIISSHWAWENEILKNEKIKND